MPRITITDDFQFPSLEEADDEGLLLIGGSLTSEKVLEAYRLGIFPWYNEDDPVLWWSPDPRFVLLPDELHVSKSMKKCIRQERYECTMNKDFAGVIHHCKTVPRRGQNGTWITRDTKKVFIDLHRQGHAISAEAWQQGVLVGGIYGILLENMFCAESMFSLEPNASKFALIHLVKWLQKQGVALIDCQIYSPHMAVLGAKMIPRKKFATYL